ncbi:MAG: ribosome-associated translation inhibitor RaiA [Chlorobi bacterium]|nr:ribosome-associated translation inhibitor RaiA [Chlorobiota bacterium]
MRIQFHPVNFEAEPKRLAIIEKKLSRLEKFNDRIVETDVYLKVNNKPRNDKTVEVRIRVSGNTLVASRDAETFEKATDLVYDVLKRMLREEKSKKHS